MGVYRYLLLGWGASKHTGFPTLPHKLLIKVHIYGMLLVNMAGASEPNI